jgi:branched-chain amino acid transport system substrate-binding protein
MLHSVRIAAAVSAALGLIPAAATAQQPKPPPIKIGFMLPYTGTYGALGQMIENGFKLHVKEQGGQLGGREVQYFKVDDESEPSKAADNVQKLLKRDQVDVLVGSVHSDVALVMAKAAKESDTLLIVPNAGAEALTGSLCSPGIVRSSFTNWQPGYASGVIAAQRGHKRAMTVTWQYAAGAETVRGFTEAFEKGGGKVLKDLTVPFPNMEFQALLAEIAAQKPDVVFAFFAGAGAVKFVKDYAAAGLKASVPLVASGFLTDGTLEAQGEAAQGILTGLHYADNLNTPRNNAFRKSFALTYKANADVYAVQGYDAAQILGTGLAAVKGDLSRRDALTSAMRRAVVDSPRGRFTLSRAGNPVQDLYVREVKGVYNESRGVAVKALADPARGCKL